MPVDVYALIGARNRSRNRVTRSRGGDIQIQKCLCLFVITQLHLTQHGRTVKEYNVAVSQRIYAIVVRQAEIVSVIGCQSDACLLRKQFLRGLRMIAQSFKCTRECVRMALSAKQRHAVRKHRGGKLVFRAKHGTIHAESGRFTTELISPHNHWVGISGISVRFGLVH